MTNKRILVLSPHPDDESIGPGGTIAKYASTGNKVTVLTIAGHRPPIYTEENYQQTLKEAHQAHKTLGVTNSAFLDIPTTTINQLPLHEFYKKIIDFVAELKPQIVLIPYYDRHIDHRYVFEAAMIATRPVKAGKHIEMLASYETLSSTHWNAPFIEPNFQPNWTVDISEFLEIKINALKAYGSQIPDFPGARSIEAIKALATFRGTQAGFASGESFSIIRKIS